MLEKAIQKAKKDFDNTSARALKRIATHLEKGNFLQAVRSLIFNAHHAGQEGGWAITYIPREILKQLATVAEDHSVKLWEDFVFAGKMKGVKIPRPTAPWLPTPGGFINGECSNCHDDKPYKGSIKNCPTCGGEGYVGGPF